MNKKVWYAPNGFEAYGEEEIKAVEQCLRAGWLAGFGEKTIEFENKVADLFGKKYGVFVNSERTEFIIGQVLALAASSTVKKNYCNYH